MNSHKSSDDNVFLSLVEAQATEWLAARVDTKLPLEKEREFQEWLAADPRHREAFDRAEAVWRSLDLLSAHPRLTDASEDPDFFAVKSSQNSYSARIISLSLAAAAIVLISIMVFKGRFETVATSPEPSESSSQLRRLADGSLVELKSGSRISEEFSDNVRRVRLDCGEAHFTVVSDANRPFVVEAGEVAVRAVGTEFNVRLEAQAVDVLVTEGRVTVVGPRAVQDSDPSPPPLLEAGGQVRFIAALPEAAPKLVVRQLGAAEIDRKLAWRASRLVFDGAPLAEVIDRFNHYPFGGPRPRLRLGDREVANLRISGRFHAANLDSFVELLERNFGLDVEARGNEILIRRPVP